MALPAASSRYLSAEDFVGRINLWGLEVNVILYGHVSSPTLSLNRRLSAFPGAINQ
jgi:hypothetical protein